MPLLNHVEQFRTIKNEILLKNNRYNGKYRNIEKGELPWRE
jgi:hypothetical protein